MPDEMLGQYRLGGLLAQDPLWDVLHAYDTQRGQAVTLAVLNGRRSEGDGAQFRQDVRVMASLRNPHVMRILHSGEIDGRLFIAMRHVEAENLADVIDAGALEPARSVAILGQIVEALEAGQSQGLVHGNLKASNVLLGADDFVNLLDFGSLSRYAARGDRILGPTRYRAPERDAADPIDHQTDVHDLTGILYQMLTGSPGDLDGTSAPRIDQRLPRPSAVRFDLRQFDSVVQLGMSADPGARYPSSRQLAVAARSALSRHTPMPDEGWAVFLSYRRRDTGNVAARLSGKLAERLGESRVFFDISSIAAGRDFREAVREAIQSSAVMLVLIGPTWTSAELSDGTVRIKDPEDIVQIEVDEGLRHRLLTIPVLVDGAEMPSVAQLPENIARLSAINAMRIELTSFQRDDAAVVDRVAEELDRLDDSPLGSSHARGTTTLSPVEQVGAAPPTVDRERERPQDGRSRSCLLVATVSVALVAIALVTGVVFVARGTGSTAVVPTISPATTSAVVATAEPPTTGTSIPPGSPATLQAVYEAPGGCSSKITITGDLRGDPRAVNAKALWLVAVLDAPPNVIYYPKLRLTPRDGRFEVSLDANTNSGQRRGRFGLVAAPTSAADGDLQLSLDADVAKDDARYPDDRRTRLSLGNAEIATTAFADQVC